MADDSAFDPRSITRPHPDLRTYYILCALMTLVGFPFVILRLMFKYHTLKYELDDKGVRMSWGVLFHREIYLTYRRIQDIHVTRNLFHRWLGLAAVSVQTASGSAGAEMTIEGIKNPERLRDFLYQQMRGAKDEGRAGMGSSAANSAAANHPHVSEPHGGASDHEDEALMLLREIRDDLRRLRSAGREN